MLQIMLCVLYKLLHTILFWIKDLNSKGYNLDLKAHERINLLWLPNTTFLEILAAGNNICVFNKEKLNA